MKKHQTVLRSYKGKQIEIDLGMVNLIENLWQHGFETRFCCQGVGHQDDGFYNPGYVSMPFQSGVELIERVGFGELTKYCDDISIRKTDGQKSVSFYFDPETLPFLEFFLWQSLKD